jgi:hypothetical protein
VDPWRSAIQQGQGDGVLSNLWGTEFDQFVSHTFEEVARQYLRRLSGAGRIGPVSDVGLWWFAGGDIDAVATAGSKVVAAGSVKWSNAFMKPADLDSLRRDISQVAPGAQPVFYLFSRSGFDPNLRNESSAELVRLIDLYRADLEYERLAVRASRRPASRRGQLRLGLVSNGAERPKAT